jgi:hypothetical protein
MAHHDEFNAAVHKMSTYLAVPRAPRIGEDAALLVIDVQEDFCPPVSVSISIF